MRFCFRSHTQWRGLPEQASGTEERVGWQGEVCLGSGSDDVQDVFHRLGLPSILGELLDCLDLVQLLEGAFAQLTLHQDAGDQNPSQPQCQP